MSHIGRVHRAGVAWLHELYTPCDVGVAHANPDDTAPYIFTEAFIRPPTWGAGGCPSIINVCLTQKIFDHVSQHRRASLSVGDTAKIVGEGTCAETKLDCHGSFFPTLALFCWDGPV